MAKNTLIEKQRTKAQIRFANLLFSGSWYCFFLLLVTFGIYVSGSMEPYVPLKRMPFYWSMSAAELVQHGIMPRQWDWLNLLKYGDFLTFPAVLVLPSLATVCSIVLIPESLRRQDWTRSIILLLIIGLICFAASGLL